MNSLILKSGLLSEFSVGVTQGVAARMLFGKNKMWKKFRSRSDLPSDALSPPNTFISNLVATADWRKEWSAVFLRSPTVTSFFGYGVNQTIQYGEACARPSQTSIVKCVQYKALNTVIFRHSLQVEAVDPWTWVG